MNEILFSRKELYELVWAESMLSLSKKYEISDVGLRKICKRMNIPVPALGYWAKLLAGRKMAIPALSEKYTGKQEVFLRPRDNNKVSISIKALQTQIENDPAIKLTVPERLSKSDKLIIETRKIIIARKKKQRHNEYVYNTGLEIYVSPKSIGRALKIMDTLIKALRGRGHDVQVQQQETYAIVFGEKIKICLHEIYQKEPPESNSGSTKYKLSGILSFRIGNYYLTESKEKDQPMEEKLSRIIAKLELVGMKERDERIERERRHREWEEQERKRKEIILRREKELGDFKALLSKSERWHRAVILRNYITAVQEQSSLNMTLTEEQKIWIEWAQKKADWYDPFIESDDELMRKVDRESLTIK